MNPMDAANVTSNTPVEMGPPSRKRARQSCETCKARKTRCVGGDAGACQYCQSMGIPCEVNLRSRKRPFYKVSEEVFDYSIKLLRRFVPEERLPELTVSNIKAVLHQLDHTPSEPLLPSDRVHTVNTEQDDTYGPQPDTESHQEVMEAAEHPLLREEMGCLVLDSLGKYRYVGADSTMRWNHAARLASNKSATGDPRIIQPLKTGLLPPTTPESPVSDPGKRWLPSRPLCMDYVGRFFQQIHSMHWFYSAEQFYTLLDQTLDGETTPSSASWLCALYSIFALGSMKPYAGEFVASTQSEDNKQASEYLLMAKELSSAVTEEASIESVRALGLLSLAMHGMCYSVAAYLYLGTAVRIAFSLGLHHDIFPCTKTSVERERERRVWWTIYTLDYETASRFGYPCAIVDDVSFVKTSSASELLLDPGPNMPLGYQTLYVSLVRLRKQISLECALRPTHGGGRLPISRVTKSLATLTGWHERVPQHLRWDSSLPPQHRRSAGVLQLRYLTSVISLTRPFLLFSVARSAEIRIPAKKRCYEELSGTCIEAAETLVLVIRTMREQETLSSLSLNDCHCIGEAAWILILSLRKRPTIAHRELLQFCLDTLSNMEKVGWCEKMVPDIEARVAESGVLESESAPLGLHDQDLTAEVCDYSPLDDLDVFETLDFDTRVGLMDVFGSGPTMVNLESLF